MRPFKWIETAFIAASMCVAFGGWAQADTVEVRVYGAQRDDRGLRRSVSTILSEFDSNGKHDGLLSRPLLGSARSRSSGYHKKV